MPLPIGSEAPEFELPLKPGEAPLRLSDYRGEKTVVLLFFPLAYSSVCTTEICSMAEDYSEWNRSGLNVEVIGISVDSPWVNQKFAKDCGAGFPILSDFNKQTALSYGVMYDDYFGLKGVAKRSAFVIDRSGKIIFAWTTEDADKLPDLDELKEVVRLAQTLS